MSLTLKGQALNQLIFIILIDSNIPKCDRYIRVIKYLFQCHGVVRLLVHMIAECFSKGMCAYAINPEYFSGVR